LNGYICAVKNIIFLLALFMLLKPVLPVIDYIVNYEYITKVLCVNKAKPKMKCNGKCHLMKELAKAAENEKPISHDKKNGSQESEVLFIENMYSYSIKTVFVKYKPQTIAYYSNLYSYLRSNSVFQPPTFIS